MEVSGQAAPSPAAQTSQTSAAAGSPASSAAPDTGAPSVQSFLPAEYATDPMFQSFKDVDGLAKAFRDTKAMVGKPRYDVPGADAAPEVVSEFYKKMGVPDTADAYGLKAPEGYPAHMGEYMTETLKEYQGIAHQLHLTPAQAAGIQKWFDDHSIKLVGAQTAASEAQAKASQEKLTAFYNQNFGEQTAQVMTNVKDTLAKAIPQEMRGEMEKVLSDDALNAIALVDRFYRKQYGLEDANVGAGSSTGTMSDPKALREEAQKLMSSAEYRDGFHPQNKATREKVDALYKQIAQLTDAAKRK